MLLYFSKQYYIANESDNLWINRKSKDDFNEDFNTVLPKVYKMIWFALKISIIFSHST